MQAGGLEGCKPSKSFLFRLCWLSIAIFLGFMQAGGLEGCKPSKSFLFRA